MNAGECGNEATIEARRTSMTKVAISFVTTCEHVEELTEELTELDIGSKRGRFDGQGS